MLSRRSFLWLTGAAGLSTASLSAQRGRGADVPAGPPPPSIAGLTSMRSLAKPITADERRARLEKARRLMTDDGFNLGILYRGSRKPFQPASGASGFDIAQLERDFEQ